MADIDLQTVPVASPFTTGKNLRGRVVEAVLAQTGFNHAGLNAKLRERLGGRDSNDGAIVAEPVIEGAAGFAAANERLCDLAGSVLRSDVVAALTHGTDGDEYRLDPEMRPYRHQLESWLHLTAADPKSVLVTSGTGSGKTECFLVPLLNDLAREAAETEGPLSGVRAIMLYPLNALIASQQERLRRWTFPFKGRVRFGLYNRLTPETLRAHDRDAKRSTHAEQVFDRGTMRASPPQILVTNVTMLEYLTIRREDRSLVENSQGRLRWIIIDEAHSYVGSASAEIALLIRRVLLTFGVKPANVRFVATSATIGGTGPEAGAALRRFLADLAGVEESQVYVVEGTRAPIPLPTPVLPAPLDRTMIGDASRLARHPAVQAFIRAAEASPITLARARNLLEPTGVDAIELMEAIADDRKGAPLLPLRVHHFMRALPGIWSCLNPSCGGPRPVDWPFGALAFERANHCVFCKSVLFEIQGCRECGEPYLSAFDHGGQLAPLESSPDADEFLAASERESEGDGSEDEAERPLPAPSLRRLIGTRISSDMSMLAIDPLVGTVLDRRDAGVLVPVTRLDWTGGCPRCHANSRDNDDDTIRSFRFGAPFLIGNAAPMILEGLKPMDQRDGLLPAGGRRLLSFTDSRQGTARFAANLETGAERTYVRSYLYHLAQKSTQVDPDKAKEIVQLRGEVEVIEAAAAASPGLVEVARQQRARLEALRTGGNQGISWNEARLALSQDPMVTHWIRAVWDRDPRFEKDPECFANFLLLRELARRPRRANALETLGLVRLRFDRIEKLNGAALPEALRRRGRTIDEWRDFLYVMLDLPVRSYFALDVAWEDVRWLLPRGGVRRNLVGPGESKRGKSDYSWPQARSGVVKPNPVLLLERLLQLDVESREHRAEINDMLVAAWNALLPLFDGGGSEYSLDLKRATIAPVDLAWLCPVTRRILTRRAFGSTPYGHREGSPFAMNTPLEVRFPALPRAFPRNDDDRSHLNEWLHNDRQIAELRARGVWRDLHDRAVLMAPYLRAEEHSAQQPPDRLRAFEDEFKKGRINILACSTTMEMGVDIGSVSAVIMTNVPPSIANYRQRVGRAGRRRQGFASSLTLARDTPLDRETFRQPESYLKRDLRPPQVKLDAPRIVQRHANALLLAHWFSQANGELLKLKAGAFFGFPDNATDTPPISSPVADFCAWLEDPGVRANIGATLSTLLRGTALESDTRIFSLTADMYKAARGDFEREWSALRAEALAAPSEAARNSIANQLKRLCRESLLKELANRALLPGHGFPTSVVPFVNDSYETRARAASMIETEGAAARRYDYPSRNADIAIREYAPGAEVVIDGLVWRSAGVTLNWQRPAHQDDVHEIQSLRYFWRCNDCGAADCSRSWLGRCPVCDNSDLERRRFLEPAGFRVDWNEPSHADTDKVKFIEPEAPRISARGAFWEPLLDPSLGRGRSSHDGLVFFAAAGVHGRGYRICLECGRAEEEHEDGINPLIGHTSLRGVRKDEDKICAGSQRPFAITEPVALGHEVSTDVAEMQPFDLTDLGGAWALASALREALARRLGIEPSEMGLGVEARRGALAQPTHSIFLFDKSAGGAGFSTQLLDDLPRLIEEVDTILDCDSPGCDRGCAACVLAADLFAQQEIIDRSAARGCIQRLLAGLQAPHADDAALPHATLSAPVAGALVRRLARGDVVTVYARDHFDLGALSAEPFVTLFSIGRQRGAELRLAMTPTILDALDATQRLGLRDAAVSERFGLWRADSLEAANGAVLLATIESATEIRAWFTRDRHASAIDSEWGIGRTYPIVSGIPTAFSAPARVPEVSLLPKATATVRTIKQDTGRSLKMFGNWFATLLKGEFDPLGLWLPGELCALKYSDRYIRSPLTVALMLHALAALRDALAVKDQRVPLIVMSAPLGSRDGRPPYLLFHDWQRPEHRSDVLTLMAKNWGFDAQLVTEGANHARELELTYQSGVTARLFLDQGFGYWQINGRDRFDFSASIQTQSRQLEAANPLVEGRGSTYVAIMKAK